MPQNIITKYAGTPRYAAIEGLRGILAWWVVLWHSASNTRLSIWHYLGNWPSPYIHGYIPVYIFMLVSGFVIANLVTVSNENYGRYLVRRFLRIFPAHTFILIVGVFGMLMISMAQPAKLLSHFLLELSLLNGITPKSVLSEPYLINPPVWSISLEMQFYLIAPFLVRFINRANILVFVILISYFSFRLAGCNHWITDIYQLLMNNFIFPSFFPLSADFFIIGIISYRCVSLWGGG